jgi:LacI family transcriptional regulator
MSVARLGTEYLLNLGHKDILLINGAEKHRHCSAFSGMANGYKASLEASGADNGNNLVLHSGIYIKDGYDAVERAMANGLKFTAVFAISDMVALGAIEFLESHGLHVPEDISVLGIDNSEIASLSRIGLSTIETCSNEVYKEDMGALATTILLDRLSSPAPAFQKRSIVLKPRLVLRNSCKRLEVISKEHLYK